MSDVFATSGRCEFRSMKQFSKSRIEIGQKRRRAVSPVLSARRKIIQLCSAFNQKTVAATSVRQGRKPLTVANKALVSGHSFRPQSFRVRSLDGHGESEAMHFLVEQNR